MAKLTPMKPKKVNWKENENNRSNIVQDDDKEAMAGKVLRYVLACRDQAREAKNDRMRQNEENFRQYHLDHDFSHKKAGQSTEVLARQKMATETTKSFFQQALSDIGEWWKAVLASGKSEDVADPTRITADEIRKITNYFLKEAKYFSHVGNCVWYAILGAISITQIYGELRVKPRFISRGEGKGKNYKKLLEVEKDKSWHLCFRELRQENYYPDPDGNLFEIDEEYLDKYLVVQMAEEGYSNFDLEKVKGLQGYVDDHTEEGTAPEIESGHSHTTGTFRPRVKLTRFFGNIIDQETGELTHENVYVTIANDTEVIQMPTRNTNWHQMNDLIVGALLEIPNSKWHTALMDAPTKHNHTLTEIFNLTLDSAMKAIHGINQIRTDALKNASQITDGIPWGTTLEVNATLQAGMKVMEPVVTGEISPQIFNMINFTSQEFNASALTSDLRQGITPMRQSSATATVEQSNTINSVFAGIAKNVEVNIIQPELKLAWMTIAQNWDLISPEIFKSLFGEERGEQLSQMDPEDVFANTVNGVKFEVFGITLTMSKAADYRKLTTLLQTIGTSEVLIEEFIKKYDFGKLLGEIMASLDIDKKKIELDKPPMPPAMSDLPPGAPNGEELPAPGPNMMSQVPQAGGGSLADMFALRTAGAGGGPQPAAKG